MTQPFLPKTQYEFETLLASAARTDTAGTNGDAVYLPRPLNALVFVLDVTAAATDAGDLLDVKVQTLIDGTNWVDVCYFTQVLGNGGAKRYIAKILCSTAQAMFSDTALTAGNVRHLFGDTWRVNWVIVDAGTDNASFTFSVKAIAM